MLENRFKTILINDLEDMFPGCLIIHLDANDIQGIPDILVLYRDKWAALEGKRHETAAHQPNQDYYVDMMNKMSYASFIYPENKGEVLYELQQTFKHRGTARLPKRKQIPLGKL